MKKVLNLISWSALLILQYSQSHADAMPQFSVSYFAGECAEGWSDLPEAQGRFLVPSTYGGGSGVFVGKTIEAGTTPLHSHNNVTATTTTSKKQFVLIGSGPNHNLAKAGTYTVTGHTDNANSLLPYITYKPCMKSEPPESGTIPTGVSNFQILPFCPSGWSELQAAKGRYLVGLPEFAFPSASFGGPTLEPGELRTHSHAVNGYFNFPQHEIAGASGCCAKNYAGKGNTKFYGETIVDEELDQFDSAVQAPYYSAMFCRKN